MQLAIGVVVFSTTFARVTKLRQSRKATQQLELVLKSIGTTTSEREKAAVLPDDTHENREFQHAELLTRFVPC